MALVLADRVKDTTTTTGTGTVTLSGTAPTGYQNFSTIGNSNTTYYTIAGSSEWEVGIGTVSAGQLARTTILSSSNAGAIVNFSAGTKDVFVTYPSETAVLSSNNAGTSGYALRSNGTGVAPTWQAIPTYLPVLTNSGSTVNVAAANGYIPVLTNGGSTVNVSVT